MNVAGFELTTLSTEIQKRAVEQMHLIDLISINTYVFTCYKVNENVYLQFIHLEFARI